MANNIDEHKDVMLSQAVMQDDFITWIDIDNIELIEDHKVKAFVGT